jgi:hypothetical protein
MLHGYKTLMLHPLWKAVIVLKDEMIDELERIYKEAFLD